MKFEKMEKILSGKFITRYNLTYRTNEGREKVYEMISRDKDMHTFEDLHHRNPDAVVIICHDAERKHVLLNREYRLAAGDWVYNFPAGLIDPGEDVFTAAKRELWEETGLNLISIEDTLADSYSAIGFSNEKNVCVVGTADGEFHKSTSDVEEIEAAWYTKEELRELLKTKAFAARSQAYCYLWSREKE